MTMLTPDENTALQMWSGLDHARLTADQLRLVLTVLLREPAPFVWGTEALVRHPDFTHELLIAVAKKLGPTLQLNAFTQLGRATLLARRDVGAGVTELWRTAYPMAVVAKARAAVPSRAPRLERVACTELIETCYDIGVGEIGSACWGEGETAALMHARSQDLRQCLAYVNQLAPPDPECRTGV
jgi:hypothetical protein